MANIGTVQPANASSARVVPSMMLMPGNVSDALLISLSREMGFVLHVLQVLSTMLIAQFVSTVVLAPSTTQFPRTVSRPKHPSAHKIQSLILLTNNADAPTTNPTAMVLIVYPASSPITGT